MTYAPQVQYTRTDDGVSIPYAVSGTGPFLLHLPQLVGNVMEEMEIPPLREWYELLAEHFTVVRFDRRTQGLSQREGFEPGVPLEYEDLTAGAEGSEHQADPRALHRREASSLPRS